MNLEGSEPGIASVLKKVKDRLSNRAILVLIFLLACSVVRGLVAAASTPLWFDEILTLVVSGQGSWSHIVGALLHGADGQPPLFYVIEHWAVLLPLKKEVALRLPSILACTFTVGCVYFYARRKAGEVVALLCSSFLFATHLFHYYSVTARPYSMLVACFAFALICYQRAAAPFWAVAMGAVLALAEALHYYAIFSVVPFGIAEILYLWRERRFRGWVWAALITPILPLILARHILVAFKAIYGAHYWAQYDLWSLAGSYGSYVVDDTAYGIVIALLCAAIVVRARFFPLRLKGQTDRSGVDPVEGLLLLGLLALPLTTYLATKVLHGAMLDRHALSAVLGMALALSCLRGLSRAEITTIFAFIVFLAGQHEFLFWQYVGALGLHRPAVVEELLVQKGDHSDLPVVVTDGVLFLPLQMYASPELGKRFVYLFDEEKTLQYAQTDSVDKNLAILREYTSFPIADFSEFTKVHSAFLVYEEKPTAAREWMTNYLPTAAASMELLNEGPNRKLYLVKLK